MKKEGSFPFVLLLAAVLTVAVSFSAVGQEVNETRWAPTLEIPSDTTIWICEGETYCFTVSGTDVDNNDSLTLSLVSGPIEFSPVTFGSQFDTLICFTPNADGIYIFEWKLTDRQNHRVYETVTYIVNVVKPPVVYDQYFSEELCSWNVFRNLQVQCSNVDGNMSSLYLLSGPGTLDPITGILTYYPDTSGVYTFTVEVTNLCGADTALIEDTISINQPPELRLTDTTLALCRVEEVCLELVGFDPENGAITIELVESDSLGTIMMTSDSTGQLCFMPENVAEATYQFIFCLADICPIDGGEGQETESLPICFEDTIYVTVLINQSPLIVCPAPQEFFTCDSDTFCFDIIANDPELDPITFNILSGNATVTDGRICVVGGESEMFDVVIEAVDTCGNADTCTVPIKIDGNRAPYVNSADDFAIATCIAETVCLAVSVGDLDENIESVVTSYGTYDPNSGRVCFDADTSGIYTITTTVTDSCGVSASATTYVTFDLNMPPVIDPIDDLSFTLCDTTEICIDVTITDDNLKRVVLGYGYYNFGTSQLCFTPDTAGTYTVQVVAEDDCGAADTTQFLVIVDFVQPPIVDLGMDFSVPLCQPEEICVNPSIFGDYELIDISLGTIDPVTGQICYTPDTAGVYTLIVGVVDSCGNAVADTVNITVELNSAPVVNLDDLIVSLCDASLVCVPFEAFDIDNNLTSLTSNRGVVGDDNVCFVPYAAGDYEIILTATDSCGAVTEASAIITVITEQAVEIICPPDTTLFACALDTFCLPISGIPDGSEVEVWGINTWYDSSNQTICFYSECSNNNKITVEVTTECATYSCEFNVTVECNSAPLVILPPDTSFFACGPSEICIPAGISDQDGNLTDVIVNRGQYNSATSQICFDADTAGIYTILVTAVDSCGAESSDFVYVTVVFNTAPVCVVPDSQFVSLCGPEEIFFPVTATDVDGNFNSCTLVSGPGAIVNGLWIYEPTGPDTINVTVRCTDDCGAWCESSFTVIVDMNLAPTASCPGDTTIFTCDLSELCIPGFSGSDIDDNYSYSYLIDGTLNEEGEACFIPVEGLNEIRYVAVDSCGLEDTCSAFVTVVTNSPPVCNVPSDTTITMCALETVQLPVSASDVNFNVAYCEIISGPGELIDDMWVYTPAGEETVTVTVRCTDHCLAVCESSFTVTFVLNQAPMVVCRDSLTLFVCDLTQICLPGFSAVDPDGNLSTVTVSNGELSNNIICFDPVEGINTITLTAIDSCGLETSCETIVTVLLNSTPVCVVPEDQLFRQCEPTEVSLPVSAEDNDGGMLNCEVVDGAGEIINGQWVYTPSGSETVVVTVRCTDECGAYCEDTFEITFEMNSAPMALCPSDTTIFACDLSEICLPGFDATDIDDNYSHSYLIGGTVNEFGEACFVPVEGLNEIKYVAVDSCGLEDTCAVNVTVVLNSAPVCDVPEDQVINLCEIQPIELPVGATDINGNLALCEIISGPGELVDGFWIYTPTGSEVVEVTIRCTDHCLATCEETFTLTINVNQAPVVSCGVESALFLCSLTEICVPNFSVIDPDGNLASVSVNTGVYNADGTVCFTPVEGENIIILTAVDSCGLESTCQVTVNVELNSAPVCDLPNDTTISLCDIEEVSLPIYASDVDGLLSGMLNCTVVDGPGEIVIEIGQPTQWVYTPTGSETVVVTVRCEDDCDAFCEGSFTVTFDVNAAPTASCPTDTTIFRCDLSELCLPGFSGSDIDNNYSHSYVVDGTVNESGEICFIPVEGLNEIKYVAVDSCGLEDTCVTNVTILLNALPVCTVPDDPIINLCEISEIQLPVTVEDDNLAFCEIVSGPGELVDGYWTYTPSGDEFVEVTIRCTDNCAQICESSFTVTINISDPPIVDLGGDQDLFLCELAEVCIDVITIDNYDSLTTSLGEYNATTNQVCFTPEGEGSYEMIVSVVDSCGLVGADTIDINIEVNSAPTIANMPDSNLYLCSPSVICLPVDIIDGNDNIASVTVNRGVYSDGQICFVPYGAGDYELILTVIDNCGLADADTSMVSVTTDQEVSLVCPNDTTIFTCATDTFCFPIGGIPDNGSVEVWGINTWFDSVNSTVCFYVDCGVTNKIQVDVTTPCGVYSCDFTVTIGCNRPPLVLLPPDTLITICEPTDVCLPVGVSDLDGNLVSVIAEGCTYDALTGTACFYAAGNETRTLTITATDSCGEVTSDQVIVTVEINSPPVIDFGPIVTAKSSSSNDTTISQCFPEEICVELNVSDPDDNLDKVFVSHGYYDPVEGTVCFLPDTTGIYCLTAIAVDDCGEADTATVCITIEPGEFVSIECPVDPIVIDTICTAGVVCVPLVVDGENYSVSTSIGGYSNSQVCFQADTSGIYTIEVIAAAECNSDTCTLEVVVNIAEPVTISCPSDDTIFLCAPDTLCYDFTASSSVSIVSASGLAYISGNQVCVPVLESGTQTIKLSAVGSCGTDSCSFDVTAQFNSAPVVELIADTSLVMCDIAEICIPFDTTDVDGNITEVTTSTGEIRDGFVCFTPASFGAYTITVEATDACGAMSSKAVMVIVSRGNDAAIICPPKQFVSLCGPDSVCVSAPITPFDAVVTVLPNGNYDKNTGSICVYVDQSGTFAITVIAEAQCSTDTCSFDIEVEIADPPAVSCPTRIDTLMCVAQATELCFPVVVTGTGVDVTVSNGGTFSANTVCVPIDGAGSFDVEIIATGICGTDTCYTTINVIEDMAPVLTLPTDISIDWCSYDSVALCFDGIFATDAESGVTLTLTCGLTEFELADGRSDSGQVCFLPDSAGSYEFCFEADDGCQVTSGSFFVDVIEKDDCDVCVSLAIDGGECTPVGLSKSVDINIETNRAIGGFELLISFDASVLSYQSADIAVGEIDGWEYFTWRLNSGSCGALCPSGLVHYIGIADVNNGDNHPPVESLSPNGLFIRMHYLVSNDQTLSDQFVPINFSWFDCSDNSFSDPSGNDLYLDLRVYNAENILIWDEEDDLLYPEEQRPFGLGAPDSCATGSSKAAPLRCVEFVNGGICIIHADSIDARGDVNLNEIAYEIADVVVFTNYFIYGLAAFTINVPGQIAATDVNADGLTLSVADLVYLIRVVIGDADPIPKLVPYSENLLLSTKVKPDRIDISAESQGGIGGAFLVYQLEGDIIPGVPLLTEQSSGMSMAHFVKDNQLRILMYNIGTNRIERGEASLMEIPYEGSGSLTLVSAEFVDYQGRPYETVEKTTMLPSEFTLHQNYPNPFNPSTTINFDLPGESRWTLTVFNINGSVVRQFGGNDQSGTVTLEWDGRSSSGSQVASGVYLYRLDADNFSKTRKMIMLK